MPVTEEQKRQIMGMAQDQMLLGLAFLGISEGLFSRLGEGRSVGELARETDRDEGYLQRWADASFAFGLLDVSDERFSLSPLGQAFLEQSPVVVQAMQTAHIVLRVQPAMKTGERDMPFAEGPFQALIGGSMAANSEKNFESQILPRVVAFERLRGKQAVAVDLGAGNGWYLRALARYLPDLRGIGLDDLPSNVEVAKRLAENDGLSDRLTFRKGDILQLELEAPVDLIAMNRALHHVWNARKDVFSVIERNLKPGGVAVIWEPNWPHDPEELRSPSKRRMAFQNLWEHAQGNRFLYPEEIKACFEAVGMKSRLYYFSDGNDAVIVGSKPAD